nr:unnamed protein product [Digitaria exilis]
MPFGLKNAGATYQRAIQGCLQDQLHRNVKAYVDDVVIKTRNPEDLIADLTETFDNLRKWLWKLNPAKCLLGFIVSERGIEANPKKIATLMDMKPPRTVKDVMKLTGCMAALNRFISRLREHETEFFKLLKKQDRFQWTQEAQDAFDKLKFFLTTPPVLIAPLPGEDLLLYISATTNVVSAAIVVERDEEGHLQKIKRHVYFVSEVLSDSKSSIEFRSRTAMKSQVLTDFISEWTEHNLPHWIMYFDGSLGLEGGGAGVLLISPRGDQLKYVLQIQFAVSNNAAEYEALLHGLKMAITLSFKRLLVYGDSMLVIKQVNKDWNRNHENMDAYYEEVRKLEKHFLGIEFHHLLEFRSIY